MRLLILTQVMDTEHPILGFFHGWVLEFAQHFERIDIICLEQGQCALPQHVHVHSLGKERGAGKLRQLINFYKFFFQYGHRARPDYVFFHMGAIMNILAAPFYWVRTRTKYLWWKTHGHIDFEGRLALRCVDEAVTAVAESFPIDSAKRRVVGHAIDVALFAPHEIEKTTDVLFVGRLSRSKRIEQVLQVAARLRDKRPTLTVKIIGAVRDVAYVEELHAICRQLRLTDVVEFIPGVPHSELVQYYQKARVFMNPSDNDGLDKVILEAMACGVVPVTGNLSFNAMLSPYNLYQPKGDIAAYATRIEEVSALGEASYQELGRNLRQLVVEQHSLHTLTGRIFNI